LRVYKKCPKNEETFLLNDDVLNSMEGDFVIYRSVDSIDAIDEQERLNFPIDFLNAQTATGV